MSYEEMNLKPFLDKELSVLFQRDTVVASYKYTWDVGDKVVLLSFTNNDIQWLFETLEHP